ncbi:MAG: radical SAM family heme chaperone HemW [Ginsengibacter sp.]
MAGIYIHIPFCKQACYYCNFHFSTTLNLKDEMMIALVKEIGISSTSLLNDKNQKEIIETIYFGGGTPSLLTAAEIELLLNAVKNNFPISDNTEITIEVNPDDISMEKLSSWKNSGINRLSIGIQSFKEKDLTWMNRAHNTSQALESIALAKEAGFDNFSVDLIFGTPGLAEEEWKLNVDTVINSGATHIACYALTVEPNTALQKMISLKKKENINSDEQANQFLLLMKWMKEAGYEHYEISNFAKPGFRSRHNSSYWSGKNYLGIGPSAHSYDGKSRRWNIANNTLYLQSIQNNVIPFEEEKLTESQKLNEYIMTSVRTMEGLNLRTVEDQFSLKERSRIELAAAGYLERKLLTQKNEIFVLTEEGKLFADGIASDFFTD